MGYLIQVKHNFKLTFAVVLTFAMVTTACTRSQLATSLTAGSSNNGSSSTGGGGGSNPTPPPTGSLPPKPGSKSPATQLSVPSTISNLKQDPAVIAGYLDVTKYGAKGDGITDDTNAFQSALTDASGNCGNVQAGVSMTVYVPPGNYLISKTLVGCQQDSNNGPIPNRSFGAGSGVSAPTLVGNPTNRPTLILKDQTFTNASSPQPMVHFVNSPDNTRANNTSVGTYGWAFNFVIRDLNFKTGNNPGAIAIQAYTTQMSYIQNIKVDATGGYGGIQGAPATTAWVNIEVDGGQYGIILDGGTAGTSTIAGLKLENQTTAGVRYGAVGAFIGAVVIAGFEINESNPAATGVVTKRGIEQGSSLTLIDGYLTISSTTQGAIANGAADDNLYFNNVYLSAPKFAVVNPSGTVNANGSTQLIQEYSHADQGTNSTTICVNGGPSNCNPGYSPGAVIVINDKTQKNDYGPIYGSGNPPADLIARNIPSQMPWAFDTGVAWVTDYGADPTGATDSTAAIRNAVAAAHASGVDEVFLPRGKYNLTGTIVLYPNTKFFGLPGGYTQLQAPGWAPNNLSFLLQVGTGDAASRAGNAIVSDIAFFLPTVGNSVATATQQANLADIHWEVGTSSVMAWCYNLFQYNTGLTITAPTRNIIQVDNGGGGRIYAWQGGGDYGPNSSSGFAFLVTNNSPLTVYGANIEHVGGSKAFYGFVSASNVRLLGQKSEDGAPPHWFYVSNSDNIMISGITNHDGGSHVYIDAQSTHVNINSSSYYAVTDFSRPRIIDPSGSYSYSNNYPLFKIGDFNNSIFANP